MELYIVTVVWLSIIGLVANGLWVIMDTENISWPKIIIHTSANAILAIWGINLL